MPAAGRCATDAEPRGLPAGSPALSGDAVATRRAWRLIAASVLAGLLVTLLWSFELVDSTIGDNVANTLLGYDAKGTAIDGAGMGVVFAFISGLAGSFTACNVAAFSAIAPLSCQRRAIGDVLRPLGWLAVGACAVSGTYGAVGALIGTGCCGCRPRSASAGGRPCRGPETAYLTVRVPSMPPARWPGTVQ